MIKKILSALLAILIIGIAFMMFKMMQPPPDDLDLRTEKMSEQGLFDLSFRPETGSPAVGPIHSWLVEVKDKDKKPVTGAMVYLDGGMPQHGHGLPTSPKMETEVSPGIYRVDGVKFSMSGWWEFKLNIEAEQGSDIAIFNVVLE